ncbi:MAG: CoA ester lyase [Firmicutes bacterium]|nr:CoA ester lyase [Bacillota bacterium]
MLRSLLFIPGNNPNMIQNADVFGADGIIFDLEDSVNVVEKDNARVLIKNYLALPSLFSGLIVIRINGENSPYFEDDLESMVCDQIDTIMLPKARIDSIIKLDKILSSIEKKKNLKKVIGIIPIIEEASSVLEVDTIASLNRVNGLLLGAEDLCSDLEIPRTKEGREIEYARSKVIMACKAYKIDSIDTPFTDVIDDEGFMRDAKNACLLGMTSKAAIHPRHIEGINSVFSPSEESILWSMKILEGEKKAKEKGLGVFSLDGKMIDKPIIERASKIIEKASKYNLMRKYNEK